MGDLSDEELRARLKYAMGELHGAPFVQPLRELQRHRAMVKRLEAWTEELDKDVHAAGGTGVGPFVAAELRNRMKEPSHG